MLATFDASVLWAIFTVVLITAIVIFNANKLFFLAIVLFFSYAAWLAYKSKIFYERAINDTRVRAKHKSNY